MELSKECILSQYQELGLLNGNENVRLVRNSVTGKIAVKKAMNIEQKAVYDFLKSHRNEYIPQIYECFENGSQFIVIEEYIEGQNLEDVLSEHRISKEEAVHIVKEICQALYPLHTAKPMIVCRDLKPENIMMTLQGHIKLIDFDIARMVSPGKIRDTVIMGTEGFAAPEQFGRRQTDCRSDIYALGTILNYIILSKFPVEEILGGRLGQVVHRCIAVNPDERYQSVQELAESLEEIYPSDIKADADTVLTWRRFLPPGYRSNTLWKMLLATIGYLAIMDLCLTMEVKEDGMAIAGIRAWIQNILVLFSQLAEIGFIFNYLGCRDKMPILSSENHLIRITGYIVLEFILLLMAVLLWMFLDILI